MRVNGMRSREAVFDINTGGVQQTVGQIKVFNIRNIECSTQERIHSRAHEEPLSGGINVAGVTFVIACSFYYSSTPVVEL